MILKKGEVVEQSRRAMTQWEDLWKKNAVHNSKYYKAENNTIRELLFKGAGKTVVLIAFGDSFEQQLKTLQEMRLQNREFDVICCDKCISFLGFAPDYCVLADASINKKWLEGVDTSKTTLISNICGNTDWSDMWKGRKMYFTNKDNINTQDIFAPISGCYDFIPASSNVGNAAVVLASSVFGYEQIILLGYDFCWSDNYYAFHNRHDSTTKDKKYYMSHRIAINNNGKIVYTSENLTFSAKWLSDYLRTFPINVVNASQNSLLGYAPTRDLRKQLEIARKRELTKQDKENMINKIIQHVKVNNKDELLTKKNVVGLVAEIIPKESMWLIE